MQKQFLIVFCLLFLTACGSAEVIEQIEPTPTTPTQPLPTITVIPTVTPFFRPTVTAVPLDETTHLTTLAIGNRNQANSAVSQILAENDTRYIPVFIELIRAWQLGLIQNLTLNEITTALETLSGQTFGTNWAEWIEWYGGTDYTPPPGFTTWKGRLLSIIDPAFGDFLQDDYPSTIRVEEIQWGGVVLDGIPALDDPDLLTPVEATYLNPTDAVFGMVVNGDARAYPLRIVDWHEMVNDEIGGVPVSIAYCTLCGAAVAYDGRASDGNIYDFGSSGFLFRSNKLMYDRQTRTLWNQLTGEPVLGELVASDVTLDLLPIVLTTWEDWLAQHPTTRVLDIETGFGRVYEPGAAYGQYFASEQTMFPVWQRSDLLPDKSQVYALRINGIPKAYPIGTLLTERLVEDVIKGNDGSETAVLLLASGNRVTVDGMANARGGSSSYSAGAQVRAYERGQHTFTLTDDPNRLMDENGGLWQVAEDALIAPNGETLPRLGGHLAYWFGWFAFFPNTQVYGIE